MTHFLVVTEDDIEVEHIGCEVYTDRLGAIAYECGVHYEICDAGLDSFFLPLNAPASMWGDRRVERLAPGRYEIENYLETYPDYLETYPGSSWWPTEYDSGLRLVE